MPKITIILALLNEKDAIESTLQNLISQENVSIEIIVMDGGSTDGTQAIINRYRDDIAHFQSEKDSGIANAWNKAIPLSTGEWIQFLGAGDRFSTKKALSNTYQKLQSIPQNFDLAYSNIGYIEPNTKKLRFETGKPWNALKQKIKYKFGIAHCGIFHRKCFFDNRKFNEDYMICSDYDLLLPILNTKGAFYLGSELLLTTQLGGLSNANGFSVKAAREQFSIQKKHLDLTCLDHLYYGIRLTKAYVRRWIH